MNTIAQQAIDNTNAIMLTDIDSESYLDQLMLKIAYAKLEAEKLLILSKYNTIR